MAPPSGSVGVPRVANEHEPQKGLGGLLSGLQAALVTTLVVWGIAKMLAGLIALLAAGTAARVNPTRS